MSATYVPETPEDIGAAALHHAHQAGIEGDPAVTDNGDGTISIASGQANFWSDDTRETIVHLVLAATAGLAPTHGTTSYLCADRDTLSWVLRSDFDLLRYIPYAVLFERVGSNGEHFQHIVLKAHGEVESIYMRTFECNRYARAYGLDQVAVDSSLAITSNGGRVYSVNHPYDLIGISPSSRHFDCTQAGVYTSSLGVILDNTQYDDGTVLHFLNTDYWVNIYLFRGVEEQDHCYTLRSGEFASVEEAKSSNSLGSIPSLISSHAIPIARITVQQGQLVDPANIQSAFAATFNTLISAGDPNRNRKITTGTDIPSGGASGDLYVRYAL